MRHLYFLLLGSWLWLQIKLVPFFSHIIVIYVHMMDRAMHQRMMREAAAQRLEDELFKEAK